MCCLVPITDPSDWYIYLHEWSIFMVNVGKYASPMDSTGYVLHHEYLSKEV